MVATGRRTRPDGAGLPVTGAQRRPIIEFGTDSGGWIMAPCGGPVHLRPAEEPDATPMASLQVRATRRALDGLVPAKILQDVSEAERERAWRREIAVLPTGLRPTVAEVDGRVVGFMGALPSADATITEGDAEVTVFVDPGLLAARHRPHARRSRDPHPAPSRPTCGRDVGPGGRSSGARLRRGHGLARRRRPARPTPGCHHRPRAALPSRADLTAGPR